MLHKFGGRNFNLCDKLKNRDGERVEENRSDDCKMLKARYMRNGSVYFFSLQLSIHIHLHKDLDIYPSI